MDNGKLGLFQDARPPCTAADTRPGAVHGKLSHAPEVDYEVHHSVVSTRATGPALLLLTNRTCAWSSVGQHKNHDAARRNQSLSSKARNYDTNWKRSCRCAFTNSFAKTCLGDTVCFLWTNGQRSTTDRNTKNYDDVDCVITQRWHCVPQKNRVHDATFAINNLHVCEQPFRSFDSLSFIVLRQLCSSLCFANRTRKPVGFFEWVAA